jgi:hypothetical protein
LDDVLAGISADDFDRERERRRRRVSEFVCLFGPLIYFSTDNIRRNWMLRQAIELYYLLVLDIFLTLVLQPRAS